MTRVSQLELYNDKDIITQICMMKQMVETGTYSEVRITEDSGNYVFEFEDQNGDVQTFTVPAKQINGVTSSQSGSTVTMRITYNDGTYTDISWTAGGDVTTNTNQTITAYKTFTVSPVVPDTPGGSHAAVNQSYVESTVPGVNNIVHKSANESISGVKTFSGQTVNTSYWGISKQIPGALNGTLPDSLRRAFMLKLFGESNSNDRFLVEMFDQNSSGGGQYSLTATFTLADSSTVQVNLIEIQIDGTGAVTACKVGGVSLI